MNLLEYTAEPGILQDRVILVTGAGDGIGRAVSLGLARHGATVVLLGRTLAKLESAYDEIEAAGGPTPLIHPLELGTATPESFAEVADSLGRAFGRLDGLLHNAADLGRLGPVEHYAPEVWERVMAVNLRAPFLLTRACLPLLRASPDASVVFTTAAVGRLGKAYWGAYAVACAALEGLARVLADELAGTTSVRVNTLDPGRVRTNWHLRAYPGEDPGARPTPQVIVPAYLYLLGPASAGITGQALTVQPEPVPRL